MAGSGERVRSDWVRAGLKDDSSDEQADRREPVPGIRPRPRACCSRSLSLLRCLGERAELPALGFLPRPTGEPRDLGPPAPPLCSSVSLGPGASTLLPVPSSPTAPCRCLGPGPKEPPGKCGSGPGSPHFLPCLSSGSAPLNSPSREASVSRGVGWGGTNPVFPFRAVLQRNQLWAPCPERRGRGEMHDLHFQVLWS